MRIFVGILVVLIVIVLLRITILLIDRAFGADGNKNPRKR